MPRHLALSIILLSLTLSLVSNASVEASSPMRCARLALVRDGHSWLLDRTEAAVRREIAEMTSGRAIVSINEYEPGGTADWDDAGIRARIQGAMKDPSVDAILLLGTKAAMIAAAEPSLKKPVFGIVVHDPDLVSLPIDANGYSTKPNFSVVELSSRSVEQLQRLRQALPFTSVQILCDEAFAGQPEAVSSLAASMAESLGVKASAALAGPTAETCLRNIDPKAEIVFLLPCVRMTEPEHKALLDGLRERRTPVLSYTGQLEVEGGALAGLLADFETALARRLANNVDQYLAGTALSELPLRPPVRTDLFFNETAASAIGFSQRFRELRNATLVQPLELEGGRRLSINDAALAALEKNHELKARRFGTESVREDVKGARGQLMPQVAAVSDYQQIDGDRARASGGLFPKKTLFGGLGVTQTIFDDETITRLKLAREALGAATAAEKAQQLDTVQAAMQAYLQFLSARAARKVVEQNMSVTQKNLELARLRGRIGTSGPEDAIRFESLFAQQRSELIAAGTQVNRARIALNRIMGSEPGAEWTPVDVSRADTAFSVSAGRMTDIVQDRQTMDRLRSYLTAYAIEHSPDIEALEKSAGVQRLVADQKSRRDYLPKVSASLNWGRLVEEDFGGPTIAEQLNRAGLPVSGQMDRTVWTAGVSASLPLFTGGSLNADGRKARAQLRQAEQIKDAAREAIAAKAQADLYSIESSYSNIGLSQQAANLAEKNLEVAQQKYERGTVSIVTLLDAQTLAFNQRQAADVAMYRFLSDLVTLQRTVGWMEVLATNEEKEAFIKSAEAAVVR